MADERRVLQEGLAVGIATEARRRVLQEGLAVGVATEGRRRVLQMGLAIGITPLVAAPPEPTSYGPALQMM